MMYCLSTLTMHHLSFGICSSTNSCFASEAQGIRGHAPFHLRLHTIYQICIKGWMMIRVYLVISAQSVRPMNVAMSKVNHHLSSHPACYF